MFTTSIACPCQPLATLTRTFVLTAALCGALFGQIPLGSALMSNLNNAAPMEGLLLVERTGSATPITGLLASGFPNRNVPAVAIDPWDGRIWIGGPAFNTTRLHRAEIVGTTIANPTLMAVITPGSGTQAIALDLNGNPVVATDDSLTWLVPNAGGGLFRVNRQTGAWTRLIGGLMNWPFNHYGACSAVCSDDSGNLWFAVSNDGTTAGRIYRLAPGLHGDYTAPPTLFAAVPSPATAGNVTSLEWVPARGSRPERLWFTTGVAVGQAIGYFENGVPQFVPGVGVHNAIEHDAVADDFWLISTATNPDEVRLMDHAGVVHTVTQVPPNGINGTPASIDVHDAVVAQTRVVPQFLPLGPFDLEICTTCPPGHLGGVVMVAPAAGTFVFGIAGVDGRIRTRLNGLQWARGTPGVIILQSGCFDPATAVITLGDQVVWPRN